MIFSKHFQCFYEYQLSRCSWIFSWCNIHYFALLMHTVTLFLAVKRSHFIRDSEKQINEWQNHLVYKVACSFHWCNSVQASKLKTQNSNAKPKPSIIFWMGIKLRLIENRTHCRFIEAESGDRKCAIHTLIMIKLSTFWFG